AETSAHPIGDEIAGGLPWPVVLFLASVVAPIIEEIFFRGVLYRHLRDATRARGTAASILLSAAVSGIVFGAIHPQGLLIAPVLATVAWPLVHAREWRDSLVAPMAAHAAHNAIILGIALTMLSA
ncbi:MAG TPA: CPBP family intramembrane glutamic endopeptidase, partial [Planctomycetota bacterium]|nr:CPBP family intramembrane glutamic endopeptidase [Planctomycetota bacterium]